MFCGKLPNTFTGDFELLGELLSDLKWLLSTVEYGAANSLLACYRDYRNQVHERVRDQVSLLFCFTCLLLLYSSPWKFSILKYF